MGNVRQSGNRWARGDGVAKTLPPEPPQTTPARPTDTPELPRDVEFDLTSVPIVTWSYDPSTDDLRWSAPVEELFGVDPGTTGFTMDVMAEEELASAPAGRAARSSIPAGGGHGDRGRRPPRRHPQAGAGSDPGRHAPAEFDLRTVITSPDGVTHKLIVRASPSSTGGRLMADRADLGEHSYLGAVVDVTEHVYVERELHDVVDRYRLLTEVSAPMSWSCTRTAAWSTGTVPRSAWSRRARWRSTTDGRSPTSSTRATSVRCARALASSPRTASSSSTARSASSPWTGHDGRWRSPASAPAGPAQPAFQVIMRDISERRAAEARDRYRASLVAHVSDAHHRYRRDGKIESWNEAAQAIYGWTEEEVLGQSIAAVVTANRTDSAAVLERGQRSHRPQGRLRGRGPWSPSTP